jgi:hyperosmotically inducible periplasmic protein
MPVGTRHAKSSSADAKNLRRHSPKARLEIHMNKSLSEHSRLIPALTLASALALTFVAGTAAAATAAGEQTKAHEESAQPVSDSWITTKVKADLLVTEETKGLDINVTTTNGIVTLSGKLDSQVQVEKAVAVARSIKGVKSVDATTLTVKPRA